MNGLPNTPDEVSRLAARIDTSVAHPARRYDYLLGGKDNFAADRESGDRILAAFPAARLAAQENRRFMHRAVTFLAAQGIRQFLDIGTGIPTSPNTHEVAQAAIPEARVVYADNDPIVLAHARALLTSSPRGATAYIDADLRQPASILNDPHLQATLDLSEPVALMLVAVLHFIPEAEDPYGLVAQLVHALAPGSYLVLSHTTLDFLTPNAADTASRVVTTEAIFARTRSQVAALFNELDLVDPGIVPTAEWRAEDEPQPRPEPVSVGCYGAVARVP